MSDSNDFNPLSLISAPVSGLFNIFGAKKQADAAENVAKMQTDAANHQGDLQDAANKRAEAFQRSQAENTYQNSEADRRANYELAAARNTRVNSIGQMLLGSRIAPMTMPAYVPGIDPRYTDTDPTAVQPTAMINGRSVPVNMGGPPVPSIGAMVNPPAAPVDPRQVAAMRARLNTVPYAIGGMVGA